MTETAVRNALEPFREGLQADGADLAVESVQENQVIVKLITSDETCEDCIMPKDMLEKTFSGAIERATGRTAVVKVTGLN